MVKCPFRLAVPFDPTDGTWYWVTTDTYGGPGGAAGDGVTDDRAAIQAVMSAAYGAGKGAYFPPATYLVDPSGNVGLSCYAGVPLRGAGVTSIISSSAKYPFWINGVNGVSVRGFKVAGNYTTDQYAIRPYGTIAGLDIQDVTIEDSGVCGIGTASDATITDMSIVNCTVADCGDFGIVLQNVSGLAMSGISCLGFPNKHGYVSHAIYLTACSNLSLLNVDAGNTSGAGIHSGIDLDDCATGVFTNCVGHNAVCGICVNQYPSVGCSDLTFHTCGGHDNSSYDRYEYLTNTNIVWDEACYGTYHHYTG